MQKKTLIAAALVSVLLAIAATSAYALELRVGDLIVNAEGGFAPKSFPVDRDQ